MGNGGLILEIFCVLAVLAIGSMLFLGNYREHEALSQEAVTSPGYAFRRYWFWALLVVAVAAFFITVPNLPYPKAATTGDAVHFAVVAQQYSFTTPPVVPLDRDVIFDVTSKDVNHGFGIYAPDGALVSQVQAMPGYVNHLPARFIVAGHYQIRCLEFCGIAHAAMQGGFDVR